MKNIFRLNFILLTLLTSSCNFLEPLNENQASVQRVYTEPAFDEGLLLSAYTKLPPNNGWSFNDVATDDAVSNDLANNYLRMASGQWTPVFAPTSQWMLNRPIIALNLFLTTIDSMKWSADEIVNKLFKSRLRGEAYALRGMLRYYMLQDVAGKSTDGQLLGIQFIDDFMENNANFNIPRATFETSVKAIQTDFDSASVHLPLIYKNCTLDNQVPVEFTWANKDQYNTVMGDFNRQRIQRRIVNCFRSRLTLLAASKAFNPNAATTNDPLWIAAVQAGALALQNIVMSPLGNRYFEAAQINSVPIVENDNNEMAWRSQNVSTSYALEQTIFPPSLNGEGQINPTQNLVDAFPTADGYPITEPGHGFSPDNPYANRDPRFARTILYQGQNFKGKIINITKGNDKKDSLNVATRTGYYLRKLIREDITFPDNGTAPTPQKHYKVFVRFTEIFLNYAEAANEVGGPDYVVPNFNQSARDVIGAIRKRAGIKQPDTYLASISDQQKMRELIRNERRLELCFEGFRFYDLRRWDLNLTEPAKGVNITPNGNSYTFDYVNIDDRKYEPYMQFGPVPLQEILKYSELKQNAGWN
ncbi:MAG: RagB/SusD family nutrient uptake outer membrane protein [Prolixibacteraceae bacterium]